MLPCPAALSVSAATTNQKSTHMAYAYKHSMCTYVQNNVFKPCVTTVVLQVGGGEYAGTGTGCQLEAQKPIPELYLAQEPLTGSLAPLLEDLRPPPAITGLRISSVNIWMNHSAVSTSAHYDPHHNLLCVLCGEKCVTLWPPSVTPLMQPHAFCGESSNHSTFHLSTQHPQEFKPATAAAHSSGLFFKIDMQAGDALFLPAGWWHEVHSSPRTIAVNYWCGLGGADVRHMAPFHLRHALQACLKTACESELTRIRAASMAHMQRMGCSGTGSNNAENKSFVSIAAELLDRHVSAWTQMNSKKRKRNSLEEEKGRDYPRKEMLAEPVHSIADQESTHLRSVEPASATSLATTTSTTVRAAAICGTSHGSAGGGIRLAGDAVAIAALSHQQLLLLLDLWQSTSSSTLQLWLLRCMSPAAAEALTDCLENGADGSTDIPRVADGAPAASEDSPEILHGEAQLEDMRRCKEGDLHNPIANPASDPATPQNVSDFNCALCTDFYGDDGETIHTAYVPMCDAQRQFSLGKFAMQVAAMEHNRRELRRNASSAGQENAEELRLEVLGRVFGLVDGSLLTKELESRKARWRESSLKTVLTTNL